jgi:dCTP deaminase
LDVFTRVVADRIPRFDEIRPLYEGPLYLEVVPRSFAVMVSTGLSLNQLRIMSGDVDVRDDELRAAHRNSPLLFRQDGVPFDRREVRAYDGLWLSLDLLKRDHAAVGYRAKHNSSLIDMARVGYYEPDDYWEPVVPEIGNRVVLEPEDFYLLLSAEAIRVPPEYAAEMTALDPSGGELRTHYAGFFDPGFGHDAAGLLSFGSRAALEIRAHDVPFALDNLQRVCKLRFSRMVEAPALPYGADHRSHYQNQFSTLSKHFKIERGADQLTLRRAETRPQEELGHRRPASQSVEQLGLDASR